MNRKELVGFLLAFIIAIAAVSAQTQANTRGQNVAVTQPPENAVARDVRRGEIAPAVKCAAKPEQSYALYVPLHYSPEKGWPVVYVFDPGARGIAPLEKMKEAAERYGYIVVASNNSHNGPWKPQIEAAQAMWEDTHAWLAIDDRRVHFAGFSGGARTATMMAQMCKCANGVFLNGAGFAAGSPPTRETGFAVFATAGLTDFNYNELVDLDFKLDALAVSHFLRRFDGSHQWAPADVWDEGFAWMGLVGMQNGRWPRDEQFIAAELASALQRAQKLEESGAHYFAWQDYREVSATFRDLTNNRSADEHVAALEKNPAVRLEQKSEAKEIDEQLRLQNEVMSLVGQMRDPNREEPNNDQASNRQTPGMDGGDPETQALNAIRRMREQTAKEKRPEKRRAFERATGGVFIGLLETGQSALEANRLNLARTYLQLAAEARPDWPRVHLTLANCLTRMGDRKAALRSLRKARDAGLSGQELANWSKQTPEMEALSSDPEFQKLIAEPPAKD